MHSITENPSNGTQHQSSPVTERTQIKRLHISVWTISQITTGISVRFSPSFRPCILFLLNSCVCLFVLNRNLESELEAIPLLCLLLCYTWVSSLHHWFWSLYLRIDGASCLPFPPFPSHLSAFPQYCSSWRRATTCPFQLQGLKSSMFLISSKRLLRNCNVALFWFGKQKLNKNCNA